MTRPILLSLICLTLCLNISVPAFAQTSETATLYFKSNSSTIEKRYFPTLDSIGQKCASDSLSILKIFTYADKAGTKKYNEQLSEMRANAVYDYLIQKFSISTEKVYVTWLGEEADGAYDLHFPSAHVQQRCVDLLVLFKKP